MPEEITVIAILNSPKKHSTRFDLFSDKNPEKTIGSIYWPKDFGPIPEKLSVIVKNG